MLPPPLYAHTQWGWMERGAPTTQTMVTILSSTKARDETTTQGVKITSPKKPCGGSPNPGCPLVPSTSC